MEVDWGHVLRWIGHIVVWMLLIGLLFEFGKEVIAEVRKTPRRNRADAFVHHLGVFAFLIHRGAPSARERQAEQQRDAEQHRRQAEEEREAERRRQAENQREARRQAEREREAERQRQEEQRRHQAEQEREAQRQREAQQERETAREREKTRQQERERDRARPREWWDVLGVSPQASAEEIRRSYAEKIKQYHPDRVNGMGPQLIHLAEARTKELNWAFAEAKRVR
jgi:cell division protein FtsN